MADSAQSDADKIRMKRLAKLGGTANEAIASTSSNTENTKSNLPTPDRSSRETDQSVPPSTETRATPNRAASSHVDTMSFAQKSRENPADTPSSLKSRRSERSSSENVEMWQDKMLRSVFRMTLEEGEVKDSHGNRLTFLPGLREELREQAAAAMLSIDNLEGAITEAASQALPGTAFTYLLGCFKRISRTMRASHFSGPSDTKQAILREARRLCMSYCIFAVTIPDMFADDAPIGNPLVDHLLAEPESENGICTDFLTEASASLDDNEGIKEAIVEAVELLSSQLSEKDMLAEYQNYVRALRSLSRFPRIVDVMTQSSRWAPSDTAPQDIETLTLLGPFFRLSPMQLSVAQNYFSAPKTRDRAFIANAQNAIRLTLRTHQTELFHVVDAIVRSGPAQRERMLTWFALCINNNHKKRALRVDYKSVSSDGFMVNVTVVLDQLCEPFMDANFGKIEKIDADYLRRKPRVDISDETKINADQKAADSFYAVQKDGVNNFISEIFFLTVGAHHYGTEAAQTRMTTLKKSVQRHEKDLETVEADRHKYLNNARHMAQFEQYISRMKQQIDDDWSTIHATTGALLDELNQARSMQLMRYLIVWLLRIASEQKLPSEPLQLPLPTDQSDMFRCLPEYFLEDIVENFKFITSHIPHILTSQQCEEIIQICITFLRNTEYVKNPGVKSGFVTILYYGVQPFNGYPRGILGDLLIGSSFAHKHLLHALMRFYIEAESTGTHTQFYDKFNIRYEIFQVIKRIWDNSMYPENLAKEASANTQFFVQFVNMLVNDATFVLDESLSSFIKIHDLAIELASPSASALSEEQRKEKQDLLEDQKGKAKSYMGLTRETMEALQLFTKSLADAFTMPEIVQRLADMLDYNLDVMIGPKSRNLKVGQTQEEMRREYNFSPGELLKDIFSIFINLSNKQRFIDAIARDGRSYKPENFIKASKILTDRVLASPEELRTWEDLATQIALTKTANEQEEEDLGEVPDEFLDPLLSDIMLDPVILPTSRITVDRATIRSHLLSDPTDPFNRTPLKIEDVLPDTTLKSRIEEWKIAQKAARAAEKATAMDTSEN